MALTPSVAASGIADALLGASGLTDYMGANNVTLEEIASVWKDYPQAWADYYDEYALQGVISGSDIPSSDPSIIHAFFTKCANEEFGDDYATLLIEFGQMFADYWSTVFVSGGAPAHGGMEVVSVSNDASGFQPQFTAAIIAHGQANSGIYASPPFVKFISDIEVVVKQITWTIDELMPTTPPAPQSFSENIS